MTQHAYADGDIFLDRVEAGVLPGKLLIPTIFFVLRPDKVHAPLAEGIPFWAIDRLAVVVYAYATIAKEVAGRPDATLQVNVKADIRSNEKLVFLQAYSVIFHTSRNIRSMAEAMITEMTGNGRWPPREKLMPPGMLERRNLD